MTKRLSYIVVVIYVLLYSIITHCNGQIIACNTGSNGNQNDCQCPSDTTPLNTLCTMRCGPDYCEDGATICRAGSPCRVECSGKAACNNAMELDGRLATDVTLICSGEDACKENLTLRCGTGACVLQCINSQGKACESISSNTVRKGNAISFECIGNSCPSLIESPFQNPTSDPTASPVLTTWSPSKSPSYSPSNAPSSSPTNVPSSIPTTNPTLFPSSNPSIKPTISPTVDPTIEPSYNPTTEPTAYPSVRVQNTVLPTPTAGIHDDDLHANLGYPTPSVLKGFGEEEAGDANEAEITRIALDDTNAKPTWSESFIVILLILIGVISCLLILACGLYFYMEQNKKQFKQTEMDRIDSSSLAVDNKMTANTNTNTGTGTGEHEREETVDEELYKLQSQTNDIDASVDIDGDNAETEALYDAASITHGLAEPMSPNSVSLTYGITPIIKKTPKNSDDNANGIEILTLHSNASSQYGITPVIKQTPRDRKRKNAEIDDDNEEMYGMPTSTHGLVLTPNTSIDGIEVLRLRSNQSNAASLKLSNDDDIYIE